jgi:hypothetical protein
LFNNNWHKTKDWRNTWITLFLKLFFHFSFLGAVVGFELRAFCLLGRNSSTWTIPPVLSALVSLPQTMTHLPMPPTPLRSQALITTLKYLIKVESSLLFAWAGPLNPCLLNSWDYVYEPTARPIEIFQSWDFENYRTLILLNISHLVQWYFQVPFPLYLLICTIRKNFN